MRMPLQSAVSHRPVRQLHEGPGDELVAGERQKGCNPALGLAVVTYKGREAQ